MQNTEYTSAVIEDAIPAAGAIPAIPFQMAVLANGLTLIVHENHKDPLISTQLRFNVGSKDEPAGRTGFAHLFEHLMFKESKHRKGNWHKMLQAMGGTGVNGTTDFDRTNYFQTVPKAALDQLLWMESDRMGHLIGGIDAASLADEVAVVKNEKRQHEGAPYGGVYEAITEALYPQGHPYAHTVLGSFEDLDNVNLETVAAWHARWYGASNAVLVIAGDIDFAEAQAKVEHWFGAMPAGTPIQRTTRWIPEARQTRRLTHFDRVPFRRIYSVWATPNANDPDSALLHLAAQILAGGPQGRLVERLVDRDRLCLGINAGQDARYVCGEFQIIPTFAPGADPVMVQAAIDEELERFFTEGPTQAEIDRIRLASRGHLLRMLDNIGQVADTLASSMVLNGRPDGYLGYMETVQNATPEAIRDAAKRWLSCKALELDVQPFDAVQPFSDPADRTRPPSLGEIHAPLFPQVEDAQLSNGLKIRLSRRPGTHGANLALYLQSGAQLDPVGVEGLSTVALSTMDAGTRRRSRLELADAFARKGIGYGVSVQNEFSVISMSALNDDIGESLNILAEILFEPAYPEHELGIFLERQIANVQSAAMSPAAAAGMAINPLIFGAGHDYGRMATVDSLVAITPDLIQRRHAAWLDPARATLVAVGDLTLEQLVAIAERAFGAWSPSDSVMQGRESAWSPTAGRFFIERPGNPQSALRVAMASPQITNGDAALWIFNSLFGGNFGARLNTNLRERRGWTYGASSRFAVNPRIGSFLISTDVQADRTLDALAEIEREITSLASDSPPTPDEVEEARHGALVGLPSAWASNGAVLNAIIDRITHGLPDDYHDGIEARIRGVSLNDVRRVAEMIADASRYSMVVSGDAAYVRGADLVRIDEHATRF